MEGEELKLGVLWAKLTGDDMTLTSVWADATKFKRYDDLPASSQTSFVIAEDGKNSPLEFFVDKLSTQTPKWVSAAPTRCGQGVGHCPVTKPYCCDGPYLSATNSP